MKGIISLVMIGWVFSACFVQAMDSKERQLQFVKKSSLDAYRVTMRQRIAVLQALWVCTELLNGMAMGFCLIFKAATIFSIIRTIHLTPL